MPATPKPPKLIQLGAYRMRVRVDQARLDAHAAETGSRLAGQSNFAQQRISLSEAMAPDYARDTLLHEVLHMSLRLAGIDPDADAKAGLEDVEERTVMAMSGVLLGVLRDNPELVAYLLAE